MEGNKEGSVLIDKEMCGGKGISGREEERECFDRLGKVGGKGISGRGFIMLRSHLQGRKKVTMWMKEEWSFSGRASCHSDFICNFAY